VGRPELPQIVPSRHKLAIVAFELLMRALENHRARLVAPDHNIPLCVALNESSGTSPNHSKSVRIDKSCYQSSRVGRSCNSIEHTCLFAIGHKVLCSVTASPPICSELSQVLLRIEMKCSELLGIVPNGQRNREGLMLAHIKSLFNYTITGDFRGGYRSPPHGSPHGLRVQRARSQRGVGDRSGQST
jgi:hypothetical protein